MNISHLIVLLASIGTMILLYAVGTWANIDFLIFNYSSSNLEIAFLPIIVGLLILIIGNRLIKRAH